MIEAELKARVQAPEAVMRQLDERAGARVEVYQDTYYDRPDGSLEKRDQELRVRTVHGPNGRRTVLTFKNATVDEASGSKPEHETRVEDSQEAHAILQGLGYVPAIAFSKRCRNYDFEARGRQMLATLVRVPEIDGTFLELETMAAEDDVTAALDDVRAVLAELGIGAEDLTRETYTGAVAAQRRK
ncbi:MULTISPECIES: class IV adenylate cyclase [Streptomyces]|uniref:Class IV adenylate cyclase n=1 Tax=Streptomyces mirabilis TaxID=68239 RepID=A0ABU3V004_9ACTN|nr:MULTISPECIES: class IV adenylate cyclase [Streptomyces]MCX4616055.1 class IV adenylate cyclase [Streptomyces mirabilis]MCX5347169.1 class IV adenylate cyclase [Streptomyces mirabilis]MDU8999513.1 class IV adenylate cyclase [Streptomyces mirabilis]QDN85890.1 class IV adenylate cyclase [Streptomyces sp. RLB3-6]QDO06702.1 class IV adenylate cyclase [Streptomyces sp. S1D4-23]